MLNIARRAAEKAGDYLERAFSRVDQIQVETKGRNDFVSEVDRHAEQLILTILKEKFPSHEFLCEESGLVNRQSDAEYQWIIDPLDGTTNFLHNFPHFAISMGVMHKGILTHGLIYDPIRREEFMASRGRGAQLNGHRIRVSKQVKLEGSLIGTGMPFRQDQQATAPAYWSLLSTIAADAAGIRRAGAAALDLAYVASGRLDAFYEFGLKPWDMAAGALLVREAGGLIIEPNGGENFMDSGNVIAGTPKLLKNMLKMMPADLARA